VAYSDNLDMSWLLNTIVFVAFNKVCTAQYFVWYLGILPVVLPEVVPGWGARQSLSASFWLIAQLLWLAAAYQLEFQVLPGCSRASDISSPVVGVWHHVYCAWQTWRMSKCLCTE
jgi:hypothetical protein